MKSFKSVIREIPKTDLHCHGINSVPFDFFTRLEPGVRLPPQRFRNFKDFDQYLRRNINPLIKDKEICRSLFRETFEKFINDGVVFVEMSFDLCLPEAVSESFEEFFEMLREEIDLASSRLTVCVEAGMNREMNPSLASRLFKKALDLDLFKSIDLYGDERKETIDDFVEIYQMAKNAGMKLKAHVGETGDPQAIKNAVVKLGLDAVQHGFRAVEENAVAEYLVKRGVIFNVCPCSNIKLGLVSSWEKHPIRQLFDQGATITLGSDDFSIFNSSVSDQANTLVEKDIFSEKEMLAIIDNGMEQFVEFKKNHYGHADNKIK